MTREEASSKLRAGIINEKTRELTSLLKYIGILADEGKSYLHINTHVVDSDRFLWVLPSNDYRYVVTELTLLGYTITDLHGGSKRVSWE